MDGSSFIGLIGILLALAVFSFLNYKGLHTFISVIVASFVAILFNRMDITVAFTVTYWPSFTSFISRIWWLTIGGGLFGALLNVTGGGAVIGAAILKLMGKRATLGVALVGVFLTLCGINVITGALYAVLPMIYEIYRQQDIPRRFAPAVICFSVLTLACTTPGATQSHNLLPTQFYGLPLYAGAVIGYATILFMLFLGQFILNKLIARAQANGEHFVALPGDFPEKKENETPNAPPLWRALIPMICFPLLINLAPWHIFFSQLIAFGIALVFLWGYWKINTLFDTIRTVVPAAINVILAIAAVMGFGSILSSAPAFQLIIDGIMSIPGSPLVSAAIATTAVAGICGSATGGIGIVLPILGNVLAAAGGTTTVALARVFGLSSLCLHALPHNGAINGLVVGCKESLKTAYIPIVWMTVVVAGLGTVFMIILFTLFPNLP